MKTIFTVCVAATLMFTSCKKCYECRILTSTTNQYGNQQSEPPIIMEKCGMTARQMRIFTEESSNTTTVYVDGKKYTTTTDVRCKQIN